MHEARRQLAPGRGPGYIDTGTVPDPGAGPGRDSPRSRAHNCAAPRQALCARESDHESLDLELAVCAEERRACKREQGKRVTAPGCPPLVISGPARNLF